MFIRTKKIKGSSYAYLVENTWTRTGSRQTVSGYLGKCITVTRQKTTHPILSPEKPYLDNIFLLIEAALTDNGFVKQTPHTYTHKNITVDLKHQQVTQKNKPAILAIDQGYLCEQTLTQLLRFTPQENPEETARTLAQALINTGITISTENLVILFEKLHPSSEHHV